MDYAVTETPPGRKLFCRLFRDYTPLIDLIATRYEEQLYTIFTTNLTPAQLEEKYGKRTVNRLNEMVEKVVFENESYRR